MEKSKKDLLSERVKRENSINMEFGEFICSFDKWTSPEEQKIIVDHLEKITQKNKK